VADSTFTEAVQVPPTAMVPPLKLRVVALAAGAHVGPPQPLVVAPGVEATTRLVGRGSVTPTPVRLTVLPAGLVMVSVRTEFTPVATLVGLKDFAIVGGSSTAIVAVAVVPLPPLVELTLPVMFVLTPEVVLVTLPVMVQLLLVGIEAPLMLTVLVPTPPPVKVAPEQPVVAAVEKVIPDGRVSLTATPDSATVLAAGLVMVIVIVDVPVFTGMLAEPKTLAMVGGATTVKVALAVPPVVLGLVEVTAPVVLTLLPAVVDVTVAVTVQLVPPAMDAPVSLIDVDVEVAIDPLGHVVATPDCVMPAGRLSVTATPVSVVLAFGFVMVRVSSVLPPDAMVPDPNPLVIVGGDATVRVAEAVVLAGALAAVTVLVVLL